MNMIHPKLTNSKKKAEFLKGLMTGQRKISELRPYECRVFMSFNNDDPAVYFEHDSNKEYSREYVDKISEDGVMVITVNIIGKRED